LGSPRSVAPPPFHSPGGEHHEVGAGKLSVVTVAQCNLGTKRRAVAQIGGDRLGSRPGPVDDHNLARRTRVTSDNAQAAPTLPAPTIPIFIAKLETVRLREDFRLRFR